MKNIRISNEKVELNASNGVVMLDKNNQEAIKNIVGVMHQQITNIDNPKLIEGILRDVFMMAGDGPESLIKSTNTNQLFVDDLYNMGQILWACLAEIYYDEGLYCEDEVKKEDFCHAYSLMEDDKLVIYFVYPVDLSYNVRNNNNSINNSLSRINPY